MKVYFFDHRRFFIGLLHLTLIALSLTIAYLLRFDFFIPQENLPYLYRGLWIALPVKMVVFYLTRVHRRWWWRFVDMVDLFRLFVANALASLAFTVCTLLLVGRAFPRSIYCIYFI